MKNSGLTLVTGASSGIGRELAILAGEKGRGVILVARRAERLETLAGRLRDSYGVRAETIVLDLAAPDSPERLHQEVVKRRLDVDALINNAGFGNLGAFHETPLPTLLDMVQLNVTALTHLTHLFLPGMLARKRGAILNVASTAALQPGPLMAVYYATKAYVLSFSEAITEELKDTGVTVTALCPGPVRTEFQARAGTEGSNLVRLGIMDARTAAAAGYRAMEKGRPVVIPGTLNRIGALAVRLSPRAVVRPLVKRLNESTGRSPAP
ncbi:MAG TPA: SDR family oxidoreductase [Vicinamibacteria bacterium]|nr:SDR family oxidoreductase [Vicinamibacteria bacterium]